LPYLNTDGTDLYNKIQNLNEIICSKKDIIELNNKILEIERSSVIKEYFKYSNTYTVSNYITKNM
jgi:hypothetical protein